MRRLFIFLSIIPALVWGQDSLNVRKVGGYPYWDGPFGSVLRDSIAYVAAGLGGLRAVDFTDPSHPVEIGYVDMAYRARGVAISGNIAYVAGRGLHIIDIADPNNMNEIAVWEEYDYFLNVTIRDTLAFVVEDEQGMSVLNISDIAHPDRISYLWPNGASSIAFIGHLALLCGGGSGLAVYDFSNPNSPEFVTEHDLTWGGVYVATMDSLAFLCTGFGNGVHIIDLSNPLEPELISTFSTGPSGAAEIKLHDNIAYVTNSSSGMRMFDVSNIEAPIELGQYSPGCCDIRGLEFVGPVGVFARITSGVHALDLSVPSLPLALGSYLSTKDNITGGMNILVSNQFAYLAENLGIRIYDISDPTNPLLRGYTDTLSAREIVLKDSIAYVVGDYFGLRVVDISDPAEIADVNYIDLPGWGGSMAIHDTLLLLADSDHWFRIYDISNVTSPVQLSETDLLIFGGIEVAGNYAYITGGDYGLGIVDISDPYSPIVVGGTNDFRGSDVAIHDRYAFVGSGNELRSLDISDPTEFDVLDTISVVQYVNQIEYKNGFLYVTGSRGGLRVIDATDPAFLQDAGHYAPAPDFQFSHSGARGVALANGLAYVMETNDFSIYDVSAALTMPEYHNEIPSSFSLHPIYPNPFNNTANISFDLPREVTGRLVVYDVLGREASVLYNGRFASGTHSMQFSGENLSSGTYFVKLETPAFNAVQKAVLLK